MDITHGVHEESSPSISSLSTLLANGHKLNKSAPIHYDQPVGSENLTLLVSLYIGFVAPLLRMVDDNPADSAYHYIPTEYVCVIFVGLYGLSTCTWPIMIISVPQFD